MKLRQASAADLPAITALYNHYVANSAATFDTEPFEPQQREPWFAQFAPESRCQLLLAEDAGAVVGFACSTPLRPKPAYLRSVETTIYLSQERLRHGTGTLLLGALLDKLAAAGVHRAYSLITVPNPASIGLHEKLGYTLAGRMHECGWKFDRWWDVHWYERRF